MQDQNNQLETKTPTGESYGSNSNSTRVQESPVLNAISAHLNKWYPNKVEAADVLTELDEVLNQPPAGLNLPYC